MKERLETGPLQVEGDWPGIFIRGDKALIMAFHLDQAAVLFRAAYPTEFTGAPVQLEAMARLLRRCDAAGPEPPRLCKLRDMRAEESND